MQARTESAWEHFIAVTGPALAIAPVSFLDDLRANLAAEGIQEAVARNDTAPIFDWLIGLIQFQGISDANASAYAQKHGLLRWSDIAAALATKPSCPRLRSYWDFADCRYRKGARTCAEPQHFRRCPLPVHPMRKGSLNQSAFSLFLFIRDICGGDLVGWIDQRLAAADVGNEQRRAERLRAALLEPLSHVYGVAFKVLSMALADLLLGGDPGRERWVTAGGSMIVVDTLVHNFLHRTGTLKRFGAEHPYGPRCYGPGGCADLLDRIARRVDAREFNPTFPAYFPRFVQHAIWCFCSAAGWSICNGNAVDDSRRCENLYCPAHQDCDRRAVRIVTSFAYASAPAKRLFFMMA